MLERLLAFWRDRSSISVGLNTWASIDYLQNLGWEFVGGAQVPWPSSLARGPYGWAQVATFVITGLMIVILAVAVRDVLPRRRASSFAVVLLALLGVALILAAFRVDTPMLRGESPHLERLGARDGVPVDHRHGCSRASRNGSRGARRPKLAAYRDRFPAACALFVAFLLLPWGNASFLLAIVTLFSWLAAVAVRPASTNSRSKINKLHSLTASR